jgi:hypothetical protein
MMNNASRWLSISGLAFFLALTCAPRAAARQGDDLKAEATQYLARHEPELRQTTSAAKKLHLLAYLSPAAFAAGDTEKARAYAEELMALGEELKSKPRFGPTYYGRATHVGNIVLGYIALAVGDVGKAKEHLLAAAQVTGDPAVVSLGPDVVLAKELTERGEREAVVEYFELCAKFWVPQRAELERWKEVVSQGGMPRFGRGYSRLNTWRFAR